MLFERCFYVKIVVTLILIDLAKYKIRFSRSWWSGNKKYFSFLFKASCALLQRHAYKGILGHVIPVCL